MSPTIFGIITCIKTSCNPKVAGRLVSGYEVRCYLVSGSENSLQSGANLCMSVRTKKS